jgi:hypothetical protein
MPSREAFILPTHQPDQWNLHIPTELFTLNTLSLMRSAGVVNYYKNLFAAMAAFKK